MDIKKFSKIKDIITSLVILIIVFSAAILLVISVIKSLKRLIIGLSNMDTVIIVTLITGGVSIAGVLISSVISKIIEYRQNTKRYLYEKKEEPYSEFIEMVYKIQENIKDNREYSEDDMLKDVLNFSRKLTLWGSNNVIRKWLDFRKVNQDQNNNQSDNLFILEDIIFEIGKDMGHKKRGLKQGDILSFFINDIGDYLPNEKISNDKF